CGSALNLATHQALLTMLGDQSFNTYIQKACQGTLSINKQISSPIPSDKTAYYSAAHEQTENPLPQNLKHGDRLWIQGPAHGYAFHPSSDMNGFNVQVDLSHP